MYFPFFIVKRPNSAKRIQRILHRYAALFDLDSGVPLLEVAVLLALFTCNCMRKGKQVAREELAFQIAHLEPNKCNCQKSPSSVVKVSVSLEVYRDEKSRNG